jgi:hypothetical protein
MVMTTDTTKTERRQSTYKINPPILNRWSMTGEEIDEDTIMSLFEAARWAPVIGYQAKSPWFSRTLDFVL